jgi:AraC-like DNA-binding protein
MMKTVNDMRPRRTGFIDFSGGFQHVLSLRLQALGSITGAGDCHYPHHWHENFELLVPRHGIYRCKLNDIKLELHPGTCILIQPGDSHEDFYSKGMVFFGMVFSLRDIASICWRGGIIAPSIPMEARVLKIAAGSRAEHLMHLINASNPENASDPVNALSLESMSEGFFWSMVADTSKDLLSSSFMKCLCEDAFRMKVISFFAKLNGRKLDLDTLGAALTLSRRGLSYRFKNIFGTSPAKAYASWRIAKASTMLKTGASVKDAALSLGFSDPFHFSRLFKAEKGLPPSQLAAKMR